MRVLIIGGGIGGLTAALALRQCHPPIEAHIYEQSPVLTEVGAGISLWPNASKALHQLGLRDDLNRFSLPHVDGALRRWNGDYLSLTSAHDLESRFGGGMLVLHRAELVNLLAQRLGPDAIHLGHTCTSIQESNNSEVTATFANGTTATADLLVGADGLHSAVRTRTLGHTSPPRYAGYTAWRAVTTFDHHAIVPAETWGPGRRFGIFPLTNNRIYWFATTNAPAGQAQEATGSAQTTLLTLFHNWHAPIPDILRATPPATILRHDLYDRDPLPTWGRGRITLLGDAAHPMTPNLGQGACQAVEDALELARCLTNQPTNIEAALRTYETRRIARTTPIVLAARRLGTIGQIENPIACRLRDTLLRLTPQSVTMRSLSSVIGYEGHLGS